MLIAPVKYYGAKGKIRSKLLPLIPRLDIYCEPYGGSGSILCALDPPAPVEVFNDLNCDLINLFRCFQDLDRFAKLKHRLYYTPYARAEFNRAKDILADPTSAPDDRAWAVFVALNQGFGGRLPPTAWSRTYASKRGMAANTSHWNTLRLTLDEFHARFMRVQIDCQDALKCIKDWDSAGTVYFLDPPYAPPARLQYDAFAKECTTSHHKRLVALILQVKGAVVLSGYANDIYLPLEQNGWERIDFPSHCTVNASKGPARPCTESVWRNPRAVYLTQTNGRPLRLPGLCYD
jgi:DNA adenine methylase